MAHEQIALLDANDKVEIAQRQFVKNREPRCPVVMIYDCSHSMFMGDRPMIDELKRGHELLQVELLEDVVASERADMSYIMYGTEVAPPTMFATPGECDDATQEKDRFNKLDFQDMEFTSTNKAILAAIDAVEERLKHYGNSVPHYAPMIFLITDGQSNDDNDMYEPDVTMRQAAVNALRSRVAPIGKWTFMPIYISTGSASVDAEIRDSLSIYPVAPAPQPVALKPGSLMEFFRWVSASMQKRSASRTEEAVAFPDASSWVMPGA